MQASVTGALLACAVGVLLAFLNDRLTRAAYNRKPSLLVFCFAVRQAVNIAYLAVLYFLAPVLPCDTIPLLIGGALGITIPSIFLSSRLAGQVGNEAQADKTLDDTASKQKEQA